MAGSSLGDVADIVMGQSPPGETTNTEGRGLPLLNGPTEFGPHHPSAVQFTTDPHKRALLGDLLFCVRGSTTGRMNWADRDYAIGRGIAAIRHKRENRLQPFLRAVIEFSLPSLLAEATGSTFPNVSAAQLAKLLYPQIEDNEQGAIAQILGTLDDKIELNRRMNETLEAIARAIFKSWFVDFDPVRAKAEGRDPCLPKHIADLFPDRFEDSELGKIPAGWRVAALPEAIDVNPPRSLRRKEAAPYLDMGNMPSRSARALNVYDREFSSGMRFIDGDTLVARITPCLENGKTCFVDFLSSNKVGWGSTEYIVLRPKPPLPPELAYFLARTEAFRAHAISNMTGTSGRQRVPASSFNLYQLILPPDETAQCFGELARIMLSKMKVNDQESDSLTAIRVTLLPKLISGEFRVKDVKVFLERIK